MSITKVDNKKYYTDKNGLKWKMDGNISDSLICILVIIEKDLEFMICSETFRHTSRIEVPFNESERYFLEYQMRIDGEWETHTLKAEFSSLIDITNILYKEFKNE